MGMKEVDGAHEMGCVASEQDRLRRVFLAFRLVNKVRHEPRNDFSPAITCVSLKTNVGIES